MDKNIIFIESVQSMLSVIDTAVALSVSIQLRAGQIPTTSVSPHDYLDSVSYARDAQAVALVKKNPWILPTSASADSAALQNFLKSEAQCKETNNRFSQVLKDFKTRSVLETARHYAAKILNDFSFSDPDFGPGASFSSRGRSSNIVTKMRTLPECTPVAHHIVLHTILDRMPHYAISCGLVRRERGTVELQTTKLPLVPGNRLAFVPKTVSVSRPICIEPLGNLLIQKSVGSAIRKRLKTYGLDLGLSLNEGTLQDRHREYARLSSIDGRYATIDLSSASDTVSCAIVKYLLPDDWYFVMDKIRSRTTILPDGSTILNEKFSSMGNGFTFELESLIFYVLALAIRYHHGNRDDMVSVYGDDIIVSSHLSYELIELLTLCGFSTNSEKTFTTGPFRESCGGDFFLGQNVRPKYVKGDQDAPIEIRLIQFANAIRSVSRFLHDDFDCDRAFRKIWFSVINRIPKRFRVFGPESLGDDVIWTDDYQSKTINGITTVVRLTRRYRGRVKPSLSDHVLACALYGIPESGVTCRGDKFTIVTKRAVILKTGCQGLRWL